MILAGTIGYNFHVDQKHIEYEVTFTKTTLDLLQQVILCQGISQLSCQSSHNGIYINPYYNKDFNNSLPNLQNPFQSKDTLKDRENSKKGIEEEMMKLHNPPKNYVITYNLLVNLYSKYEQIYLQATKPTGSLNSYIYDINEKSSEFYAIYDKIIILKPGINSSVLIFSPIYIA